MQQEVTLSERDGRTTIESYRLNFHVHFQVNFAFVMRLTDWSQTPLDGWTGSSDRTCFFIRGSRQKRYKNWYGASSTRAQSSQPTHLHPTHTHLTLAPPCPPHPGHRFKRGGLMAYAPPPPTCNITVNPDNMNAKRPLYYYGTRSDLENSLRIEVWDWDPTSANDLIGFAEVPLRGILLSAASPPVLRCMPLVEAVI